MDKEQFREFCKKDFESRGFKKVKNMFYLPGCEVICGISLQRSLYGSVYYINYDFAIGDFTNTNKYPTHYEMDIYGRVGITSKRLNNGKYEVTAQIRYEDYTEDELKPELDKAFEEEIFPPIQVGKKYILDNLEKEYFLSLRQEEVMQKLQA